MHLQESPACKLRYLCTHSDIASRARSHETSDETMRAVALTTVAPAGATAMPVRRMPVQIVGTRDSPPQMQLATVASMSRRKGTGYIAAVLLAMASAPLPEWSAVSSDDMHLRISRLFAAEAAVELSEESALVVDAWAVVSRAYVDPDFGGLDWKSIRSEYVKKQYKNMKAAREAVTKMLGLLGDKYTRYVTPAQYKALLARYESPAGQGGVGVVLGTASSGGVLLLDVEPGSPAATAGLLPGDTLLSVGGTSITSSTSPDEAASLLFGPLSERVQVSVRRGGDETALSVGRALLQTGAAKASSARAAGLDLGVVTLRQFSEGLTVPSLREAMGSAAIADAPAVVLDLRSNPGGHFPSAVEAAKLFLREGKTIVSTSSRTATNQQVTIVDGPYASDTRPLYLLVNKGTASAAEVFAAALAENGRAVVVGERTFGKGIVQTIAKVSDGGAVICTTARYLTPLGNDINGIGVEPNVASTCASALAAATCVSQAVTTLAT